ncbi:YlmC/YmxH family sporulation protein [Laceyella putida]|uniref:YlmC/YmxH family sporulation protein n=1 Tax=Laceyella putida TaxID=110101 RepID=A0ABW2RMS8_9BACL
MKISELQAKDVVNIADGRKLGQIYDLDLDLRRGVINAIVVPGESKWFGFVSSGHEWVIPWRQIVKIGSDVILVRLEENGGHQGYFLPDEAQIELTKSQFKKGT